ncbi:MAG: hypothetical protein OXN27_23375 [Candidatus Poribacteria bacterium]|nr:hypothetical protein [Candidatus Poribacteria bacterium]
MAVDPATALMLLQAAPAVGNMAKEFGGGAGMTVRNMLPKKWGKARDIIGGLASSSGGFLGVSGYQEQLANQQRQDAADQLIDNFMKNPGSQFVNPQLLARAQRAAGGGMGRDPYLAGVSRDWIEGRGGVGYDTNLANQMLRGDIPPSVAAAMDRRIGSRFDTLRRQQGGQLARSGVLRSSAGGRLMADAYTSERNALTDAYMNTMLQRQGLGLSILNSADASRRAYQGMGANQLGRQADRDLAYQQMGFNVLSDADRRKYARETFGVNARLGLLGQQQARRDAGMEASAGIVCT